MIQALIVDDEYFVRIGLQHMIPWNDHGINIVGVASNGESALKIMEAEQVDLLITDLSMPIMSGFELIEKVRETYPDMHIVVLTCHQDFQYAREAVRYGVIDYIVKTELEDESLNSTIMKIVDRIRQSRSRSFAAAAKENPYGVLFVPMLKTANHEQSSNRLAESLKEGESPYLLARSGLFIRSSQFLHAGQPSDRIVSMLDAKQWIPVVIRSLPEMPDKTIKNVLEQYMERCLFYQYAFDVTVVEAEWNSLHSAIQQPLRNSLEEIGSSWKQFAWIYDDAAFERWDKFVRELKPPVGELVSMFQETLSVWRYFGNIAGSADWQKQTSGFQFWQQWADWLREIRPLFKRDDLSDEVSLTIVKAGQLMLSGMKDGLGQAEIARQVNINRSYFSHCFKQFVGMAFHELMNALRVDKARHLLEQTNDPIYIIADQVGFKDDKYFSKFIKQQTGKLPREIRSCE